MAASPITVMVIIAATLAFTAIIFGDTMAANSFPALGNTDFSDCHARTGGFLGFITGDSLGYIGCIIGKMFNFVMNIFKVIFGTIVFIVNLISFNIPGAPWYVRAVIGTGFGGTLLWSMATLMRGN